VGLLENLALDLESML
jgi:hypothetical protein